MSTPRRPRMTPIKRTNPSGQTRWFARYRRPDGTRGKAGTYKTKREAQDAIDAALAAAWDHEPVNRTTFGEYAGTWTARHPRAKRTNDTNSHRISRILDLILKTDDGEDLQLRDWPLADLRRRHALDIVQYLLADQGRSKQGATNILRAVSAMCEDAITDGVTDLNFVKGVTIRATDPRIQKKARPIRVWTFEQMHTFAAACGAYEGLVRCYSDCGLRLSEALPLRRQDLVKDPTAGWLLLVRRSAHHGVILEGTKTDHDEADPGRLAPVAPSHLAIIQAAPTRIDTDLLWPTPTGKLWREDNFRRDVWKPAQEATGLDIRPHEMRHSYVSVMRASGVVDDADLADVAGHGVDTMLSRYTHALKRSYDAMREVVG